MDTAMEVRKALTISNRQHEMYTHVHVITNMQRTLVVNLFTELSKWQLGVVSGGVLANDTHCWCTLLVQDDVQGGKLQRRLVAGVISALRTVAKKKEEHDSPMRMNESKGAECSIGPISVVVNTVERAVEGGQEFTVFKVATPVWAEATVVEEVLRTIAVRAQLRIIAAQVESTPTTAGMAVCVKDEALGGALRAGTVEVVASEITRRVRHFIASSCASPPSLPPLEHTTKWLNYLEGVARGRLQTLSKERVCVGYDVTLLDADSAFDQRALSPSSPSPSSPCGSTGSGWALATANSLPMQALNRSSPEAGKLSTSMSRSSSSSSLGSFASVSASIKSVPVAVKEKDRSPRSISIDRSTTIDAPNKTRLTDSASSMLRSSSTSKLVSLTLKDASRARRRPPYTGGPPNHCWRYMPWARGDSAPCMRDFTLLQKVGTGMTSEVFLARVRDASRLAPGKDDVVVLKVMPKARVIDMGHRVQELVVSERSSMTLVQGSKFILHLFGAFQDEHVLCLVTELAAVDFFNQMTNHFGTRAYWSSVKVYAAQILLALEHMHSKRLLYRDLKPENMLVRMDGTLLIADFGMSIILPKDGDKAHSICGTAEYMSPEMVEHSGYSFMSEVWSFGVFLFEMLTGATPFECDAPQYDSQVVLKQIREFTVLEFPPDVQLDKDARMLISSLLRRKESDRLGSKDVVGDYKAIKEHSWFSEIDWAKVSRGEQSGHITVPYKLPKEALPASTSQQWSKNPVAKGANVACFDDF